MTNQVDSSETNLLFGEILRNKREELKMRIVDVSSHFRVRVVDIEALESNQIHLIANHIYVPGFIRSYARFLRIDNSFIEEQIKMLQLRSNTENKAHVLINLEEDDQLKPSKTIVVNGLVVAILLMLISFLIYSFTQDKSDLITNADLIDQLKSILPEDNEITQQTQQTQE